VTQDASLFEVATVLGKGNHRVPVVNSEGKCVSIISQSTIIQFFNDHFSDQALAQDGLQSVEEIGVAFKKVVCVPADALAVDTFSLLDKHRLSGLAVVDREGRLVGNTSGTDLKLFVLMKGQLSLKVPILEYLSQIRLHKSSPVEIRHPSSSVTPDTTIAKLIAKLAATKFHRMFVVDPHNRPVGVVSLTDILRYATVGPEQLAQQIATQKAYHTELSQNPHAHPQLQLYNQYLQQLTLHQQQQQMAQLQLHSHAGVDGVPGDHGHHSSPHHFSPHHQRRPSPSLIESPLSEAGATTSPIATAKMRRLSLENKIESRAPQFGPILEVPGTPPEQQNHSAPTLSQSVSQNNEIETRQKRKGRMMVEIVRQTTERLGANSIACFFRRFVCI